MSKHSKRISPILVGSLSLRNSAASPAVASAMPRSSSAAKVEKWTKRLERLGGSSLTAAKFYEAEGASLPSLYQRKRKLTARSNSATKSTQSTSAFAFIELLPPA